MSPRAAHRMRLAARVSAVLERLEHKRRRAFIGALQAVDMPAPFKPWQKRGPTLIMYRPPAPFAFCLATRI